MSKIRIKNFGPIKNGYNENDGWLDLKKVTVFIGNQGSGKSTIAKLISIFMWIEKVITRGDYPISYFEKKENFLNQCEYHGILSYFKFTEKEVDDLNVGFFNKVVAFITTGANNKKVEKREATAISYIGNKYSIDYDHTGIRINKVTDKVYNLPQIMYIPADRNLLSTIDDLKTHRITSKALAELLAEFQKAKKNIASIASLPINNIKLEYDLNTDTVFISGSDYKIKLSESSSGIQSAVPLYLVSNYLANKINLTHEPMNLVESERFKIEIAALYENSNLTEEQRRIAMSVITEKFNKTAFINIVEEPEQNLYPSSQWELLKNLLEINNRNEGNMLIINTHSPYIINFLTLCVKAESVYNELAHKKFKLSDPEFSQTNEIVPMSSSIKANDLAIYELNEVDGSINKLGNYEGIPSDKNYLNQSLAETGRLFDSLLEIEEEL